MGGEGGFFLCCLPQYFLLFFVLKRRGKEERKIQEFLRGWLVRRLAASERGFISVVAVVVMLTNFRQLRSLCLGVISFCHSNRLRYHEIWTSTFPVQLLPYGSCF